MNLRVSLAVVLLVATAAIAMATRKATEKAEVERGRYLATVSGCNDCHSPKLPRSMQPDPARLLSGRPDSTPPPTKPAKMGEISASADLTAWWGPWGVSYAANLTPIPPASVTATRKRRSSKRCAPEKSRTAAR